MTTPIKRDDFYDDLAHASLREALAYQRCERMARIYRAPKKLRAYYRDQMRDAALSAKRFAARRAQRRVQQAA